MLSRIESGRHDDVAAALQVEAQKHLSGIDVRNLGDHVLGSPDAMRTIFLHFHHLGHRIVWQSVPNLVSNTQNLVQMAKNDNQGDDCINPSQSATAWCSVGAA